MNDTERLKEAIRAIFNEGISFVLIGGLAMVSHGANKLTLDVDFVDTVDPEKLERLSAFLPKIYARVVRHTMGSSSPRRPCVEFTS